MTMQPFSRVNTDDDHDGRQDSSPVTIYSTREITQKLNNDIGRIRNKYDDV
jgi:hypothetical protein